MLLDIKGLEYRRGQGEQSFTVELPALMLHPGDLVAVTGRSGSGKSTVLELIGLLTAPRVSRRFIWRINGLDTDINRLWQRRAHGRLARIRATSMGFILQTGGLLPYLSVEDNLGLVRRSLGLPRRDAELEDMIERLGIAQFLTKKPHQLSVGEQQRASIVRALAHRPSLLLADEPTSALDPRLGDRVMELLIEQARAHGIATLLATHEVDRVAKLGLSQIRAEELTLPNGFGWRFAG